LQEMINVEDEGRERDHIHEERKRWKQEKIT
jgi:hypothetical protein